MTTPTDDELLRLCDEVLNMFPAECNTHFPAIARALKSRLTSQSRDEVVEELAEAQKALLDAETRGWNDGVTYSATRCDQIADSHAYSAEPMISGKHDGARECAREVRALKSPTK